MRHMATRLRMIILYYMQMSNNYIVYLKLILRQLYLIFFKHMHILAKNKIISMSKYPSMS